MSSHCDALWRELCQVLRLRGELSFQHERLTPAEVADTVLRANGDPRVQQFVWSYYYPRRYGRSAGEMSDDEAAALIASFRKPRDEAPAPDRAPEKSVPLCELCHRKPAKSAPANETAVNS